MSGGASVRTLTEAERFVGEHLNAGAVVVLPEVGPVPAPIADLVAVLPPAHAGRLLLRDSRRKRARSRART